VSFWVDTTPPLLTIIQPTLPPLVYDNKGTDIWGTIPDPSTCAISYLSPTTSAMFGEDPNEIGVGDVLRAQSGHLIMVPININATGLGPVSTFSYEILVDFDDNALALTGANFGVSGPDPAVPAPWTGATPDLGPDANWTVTADFGLGTFGALKIAAEYIAPNLVDGSENMVNICFTVITATLGVYPIDLRVIQAEGGYIEADDSYYDFNALDGSIEVYAPTVGTIIVYDADDVDPATPEVDIDITVTTDAVDGTIVTIPVGAMGFTAAAVGGVAVVRVDNFASGPNTLIAQAPDQFCPNVIGYSNALIAIYNPGLVVTITDPISGTVFGTGDDVDLGTAGVQIEIVGTTDANDGSTVTITANGSTDIVAVSGGGFTGTVTLSPGNNLIQAVVTSATQGTGSTSVVVELDISAPLVVVTILGGTYTTNATVTVDIWADDQPSAGLQTYNVDCGAGYEGPQTYSPACYENPISVTYVCNLPAGSGLKTVTVEVIDCVGNAATGSDDIFLDEIDPSVVITDPIPLQTITVSSVTVVASCTDDVGGSGVDLCRVWIDGLGEQDSGYVFPGIADGPHTAYARVTDMAGNESFAAPVPFTVFTGVLQVTITTPTPGDTISNSQIIPMDGTYANAGAAPSVIAYGVPMITDAGVPDGNWWTAAGDVDVGADGVVTITVTADDGFNVATDSITICVDSADPTVDINAMACQNSTTVVVTGNVDGTGVCGPVGVVVNPGLVDANVVGAVWTATLTLAEGNNTINATATDAAGNTGVALPVNIEVDITDPGVNITFPLPAFDLPPPTLVVTATVTDDGYSCDLNTVDIEWSGGAGTSVAPMGMDCAPGVPGPAPVNCTYTINGLVPGDLDITVTAVDVATNTGSDLVSGTISSATGFMMAIDSPPDGAFLVTVNGITFGSVIATIPADVSWIGGSSPYDTSGLAVEAGGRVTTGLTITGPTTASGKVEVACDDSAGSFGTTTNITVSTYGVLDSLATPAIPASITVTIQLGEIGAEEVVVEDIVGNFSVPVNAYYDATFGDGLGGYDIRINYDPLVVNVDCAAPVPVSGSDATSPFYAPEFGDPIVPTCDNVLGEVRFFASQLVSLVSPIGFFNIANINMIRVGAAGTSSALTATLLDFCNTSGDCFALGGSPPGYPWPVFPTYVKDGNVDVVAPLPPVLDQVCDTAAPAECNPASIPGLAAASIDNHGSKFDCGGGVTVNIIDTGCTPIGFGALTSCTDSLIVWGGIIVMGGSGTCCDISVTNTASGLTSDICVGCLCVD
jgi:hypothetical protein